MSKLSDYFSAGKNYPQKSIEWLFENDMYVATIWLGTEVLCQIIYSTYENVLELVVLNLANPNF